MLGVSTDKVSVPTSHTQSFSLYIVILPALNETSVNILQMKLCLYLQLWPRRSQGHPMLTSTDRRCSLAGVVADLTWLLRASPSSRGSWTLWKNPPTRIQFQMADMLLQWMLKSDYFFKILLKYLKRSGYPLTQFSFRDHPEFILVFSLITCR